jgi:hypothetical protein
MHTTNYSFGYKEKLVAFLHCFAHPNVYTTTKVMLNYGYCYARRARAMVSRGRDCRRHAVGASVALPCVVGFSRGRADGKLTRKRPLKILYSQLCLLI